MDTRRTHVTDFYARHPISAAQVLTERLDVYTQLRAETRADGLPAGDEAFHGAYVKLVAMVRALVLGGMRFVARKPAL
ncbi:MAG: hypothetical protein O2975_08430 [Proteobacteria bacterium]|nr:hypothetical protein [Pseudomonadota bacterium]